MVRPVLPLIFILSLAWTAIGCRKKEALPVPIKGKVVFPNGSPVKNLIITFHPQENDNKRGKLLTKVLDAEGTFSGECQPGEYKVTLASLPVSSGGPGGPGGATGGTVGRAPGETPRGEIPEIYLAPATTKWTVTVPPGGDEAIRLTLD
jgi:hypothetical protein